MNRPDLAHLQQLARQDDWHRTLVGSDVRLVIAYALELEEHLAGPELSDEEVKAEPMLQHFVIGLAHPENPALPVNRLFAAMARRLVATAPRNPERTVALRKLLEGKDAAVRAVLSK